jgi:hypothetical protein
MRDELTELAQVIVMLVVSQDSANGVALTEYVVTSLAKQEVPQHSSRQHRKDPRPTPKEPNRETAEQFYE